MASSFQRCAPRMLVLWICASSCNAQQRCPESLPSRGPLQTYIACSELVNRRGEEDLSRGDDPGQGAAQSIWSDEHSSLVLVHDLPVFISRLPLSLIDRVQVWNDWLIRMEPEWRKRNGGITQVSYAGSKDAYNLFREARASEDLEVSSFGTDLLSFVRDRVLTMQKHFNVTGKRAKTATARGVFKAGLSQDMCESPSTQCSAKDFVTLYAWCNVFHRDGPLAQEQFIGNWHGHQWDWHGYLVLNGTGTQTGFFSPFERQVFALRHANNHLVMLPGGVKHAALHPSQAADPRLTMAFDVRFEAPLMDHGIDLLEGAELAEGQPLRRWDYATMYRALNGFNATSEVQWGGAVDYASLIGHRADRRDAPRGKIEL